MALLADIGRSTLGRDVNQTLGYLLEKRRMALSEKQAQEQSEYRNEMLGMQERQLGLREKESGMDMRIKENQLEMLQEQRKKLNEPTDINVFLDTMPGGRNSESSQYLLKAARGLGFIGKDGVLTRGDAQQFITKVMNDPVLGGEYYDRVVGMESQKYDKLIEARDTTDPKARKEILDGFGIKEEQLPEAIQSARESADMARLKKTNFEKYMEIKAREKEKESTIELEREKMASAERIANIRTSKSASRTDLRKTLDELAELETGSPERPIYIAKLQKMIESAPKGMLTEDQVAQTLNEIAEWDKTVYAGLYRKYRELYKQTGSREEALQNVLADDVGMSDSEDDFSNLWNPEE